MIGGMPSGWPGYLVAVLTVVITLIINLRKGKVDESALILGKWKDLVDTHQEDIRLLKQEFAEYKRHAEADFAAYKQEAEAELAALRQRLRDVEAEFAQYRRDSDERVKLRDEEISALKREISQISQSTAVQLGRVVEHPEDVEILKKLERAGHNSLKGVRKDERP